MRSNKIEATLRGDIFGGLTAAVVALPLAIAFGVVAFAPLGIEYASTGALVGLLGAIFTGLFAAWFGGTPSQVTGPTGPMTVVSTAIIASVVQTHMGDLSTILVLLALAIVIAGVFQIILGIIGAGSIVRFMPYPVVAGFMNGIAIIIFIGQLKPFFGISGDWAAFSLDNALVPMLVGTTTVIAILVAGRISKAIPGALVGLVVGIVAYIVFASIGMAPLSSTSNPMLVGTVPNPFGSWEQMNSLMPVFNFASLANITAGDLQQAFMGGLALSILGSIDSLLTSVVADKVTQTRHDSRKELIGQGIGNIVSGLGGGLAGAGATVRTLVNVNAGGRSKRSGMLHSVVLFVVVMALGAPAGWIPLSALAGILFVTAVSMIDYYSLELIKRKTVWYEFAIMVVVAAITVAVDLMVAVAAGCGIALLLFVWKQVKSPVIRRRLRGNELFSRRIRSEQQCDVLITNGARTLIYELNGSLFFGTADAFSTSMEEDIGTADRMIFDFTKVTDIDLTGVQILLGLVERLHEVNCKVCISGLERVEQTVHGLHDILVELDVVNKIGKENIFSSLDYALEAMEEEILHVVDNDRNLNDSNVQWLPVDAANSENAFSELLADIVQEEGSLVEYRSLVPGEALFTTGEPAEHLALIIKGRLSVVQKSQSGATRIATVGQGAIVGIRTLFDEAKINSSVYAESPSEVYLLSKKALTRMNEMNPTMVAGLFREMLRSTIERLDSLTTYVAMNEPTYGEYKYNQEQRN